MPEDYPELNEKTVTELMNWTADLPAIEGWYWHRCNENDVDPDVLWVAPEYGVYTGDVLNKLDTFGGQWAGPLKPPKS